MNATAAICSSLLKGETLTIKTAFDRFGISNLPREIGRSVERKFGVYVSKTRIEGKSRYGVPCSWFQYRLNPLIEDNRIGVQKMLAYVQSQLSNPKTETEQKNINTLRQLSLL